MTFWSATFFFLVERNSIIIIICKKYSNICFIYATLENHVFTVCSINQIVYYWYYVLLPTDTFFLNEGSITEARYVWDNIHCVSLR